MGKAHAVLLLISVGVFCAVGSGAPSSASASPRPAITGWAWKRPEDLSWAAGKGVDVAVLLATFSVRHGQVLTELRREALIAPKDRVKTAVFRIEGYPEQTSGEDIALSVVRLASQARIARVQIDFDARVSQRAWYQGLLERLRRGLPSGTALEMTALASWCREEGSWLETLPVDGVVPMFFRMGSEGAELKRLLAGSETSLTPICRTQLGISLDEPVPIPASVERVFVFNPRGWNERDAVSIDTMLVRYAR